MVRVKEVNATNASTKQMDVGLFADTKSEVTNDIMPDGMINGYTIMQGSTCITASGEMAFRKSDGTWNWV